jgi:hypothetical protein
MEKRWGEIAELGLLRKQLSKISVKRVQELVHFEHIMRAHWFGVFDEFFARLGFDGDRSRLGLLSQLSKCETSLTRIAVLHHSRNETLRMTIGALYEHHPEVWFARKNVDIFWFKTPVTNSAPVHAVENDPLDLIF